MSFLGSFFGSDQRNDITNGNNQANAALASGYNTAQGDYQTAANSYDPYVQQGQAASTFYGNALGLNGDAARAQAENTITSDPLWSGQMAMDSNNVMKDMNARGLNGSGAAALAGQRVLYQNYNNALQNYANLGAQGLSATGAKAGVTQAMGDNAYGYGATKANQAIGYGNALAANENTGINNVLGVLGTAARFVNPMSGLKLPAGYSGSTTGY